MIKTYTKNNKSFNYQINYKKIKHVYFRHKDNLIIINANKKILEKDILKMIDENFDSIYKLINHNKKESINPYSLWGVTYTKEDFFKDLAHTNNNYYKILEYEIITKIVQFKPELQKALSILGLKEVSIKVKPLKSKFGSCHIKKRYITINSFLAKVDPIYLYYVLLHEYAHFIVANHSNKFYQTLDLVMDNHKAIQKNLRKHIITFT